MERLDNLIVDHFGGDMRELVLAQGRISELDQTDAIDYLLVSCRSKDYDPAQGGWIAELFDAGISVEILEREPAMDLRPQYPCWVSKDINRGTGHYFKRLVVFEPIEPAVSAAKDIWIVFQALRLFAGDVVGVRVDTEVRVAVPVLSSLTGEADFLVMLRMIFFASVSLAARGRWKQINILVSEEQSGQAAAEFSSLKNSYLSPPTEPEAITALVASVKAHYPDRVENMTNPEGHGLTDRQAFAIYHYTHLTYRYVNRALRQEDVTDPEFVYFQSFIEAVSTGLANLNNYLPGAIVERQIMPFDGIEDIYKVSSVVREAAYTSTTKRASSEVIGYRIILKGEVGKDVEEISEYPEEQEVLFDSAMLHLVSKVEEKEWEPVPGFPVIYIAVTTDELLANTTNIHFSHL